MHVQLQPFDYSSLKIFIKITQPNSVFIVTVDHCCPPITNLKVSSDAMLWRSQAFLYGYTATLSA